MATLRDFHQFVASDTLSQRHEREFRPTQYPEYPQNGFAMEFTEPPNSEDSSSGGHASQDQLERLQQARYVNDQRLKSRFEQLFTKYGHDFTNVGDEIDLRTGQVVVDNGHLAQMQHEVDPGTSASSRFVRTFQENLEHENDESSADDPEDSDVPIEIADGNEVTPDELRAERLPGSGRQARKLTLKIEDSDESGETPELLNAMDRPAPRLAHLLIGESVDQPINLTGISNEINTTQGDADPLLRSSDSESDGGLLRRIPDIGKAVANLAAKNRHGSGLDEDTIQALGASIANQLASLMSLNVKEKSKKRRWHRGEDPRWDYPEIDCNPEHAPKRPRYVRPGLDIYDTSPNEKRSLWAPAAKPGRPRRLPRPAHIMSEAAGSVLEMDDSDEYSSTDSDIVYEHTACHKCGRQVPADEEFGLSGELCCKSCGTFDRHLERGEEPDSESSKAQMTEYAISVLDRDDLNGRRGSSYAANTSRRLTLGQKQSFAIRKARQPVTSTAYLEAPPDSSRTDYVKHHTTDGHKSSNSGARSYKQFTLREDNIILEMREMQRKSFVEIAKHIPGRSAQSICGRYRNFLLPNSATRISRDISLMQGQSTSFSNGEPSRLPDGAGRQFRSEDVQAQLPARTPFAILISDQGMGNTRQPSSLPPSEPTHPLLSNSIGDRSFDQSRPCAFPSMSTGPQDAPSIDLHLGVQQTCDQVLGDSINMFDPWIQQRVKTRFEQQLKFAQGFHKPDSVLLRATLDSTLQLQSDLPLEKLAFAAEQNSSNPAAKDRPSRPSAHAAALFTSPQQTGEHSSSHMSPHSQAHHEGFAILDKVFSAHKYHQLMHAVADFGFAEQQPSWPTKVKQIYVENPADGRLNILLDIITTDSVDLQQKSEIIEDVLSSASQLQHEGDGDQKLPKQSPCTPQITGEVFKRARALLLDTPPAPYCLGMQRPHGNGDALTACSPKQSQINTHLIATNIPDVSEKHASSNPLSVIRPRDRAAAIATSNHATTTGLVDNIHTRSPEVAPESSQDDSPIEDAAAVKPVITVTSASKGNECDFRSSPLNDKASERGVVQEWTEVELTDDIERRSAMVMLPPTCKIMTGSGRQDGNMNRRSSHEKESSPEAAKRKLQRQHHVTGEQPKCQSMGMLSSQTNTHSVPNTEGSGPGQSSQVSVSDPARIVNDGAENSGMLIEEDNKDSVQHETGQPPVFVNNSGTTDSGTSVVNDDPVDLPYPPSSMGRVAAESWSSPIPVNRAIQKIRDTFISSPAAAPLASSSSARMLSSAFRSPARIHGLSSSPGLTTPSRLAKSKQRQMVTRRISTPTRTTVHRSPSSLRTQAHLGFVKRVVETPIRDLGPDNSDDELSVV